MFFFAEKEKSKITLCFVLNKSFMVFLDKTQKMQSYFFTASVDLNLFFTFLQRQPQNKRQLIPPF